MIGNKKNRNIGAAILFILFSLLFFVLAVRFITIQYTGEAEGRVLAAKAAQQYLRKNVIKAERGKILDHTGEVIAEDSTAYTLVGILDEELTTNPEHPRHVVDPRETAKKLSEVIDMSEEEIYSRLTKDAKQVEFGVAGRDLSHQLKAKVEKLQLPGISFIKDSKRFYPNGIFASHLIGYAQKEELKKGVFEIQGKMGLEQSYDELLKGKDGEIQFEGDKWNYILPNSKNHIKEPVNGHHIYLTIDKKIQTFLEDAMNNVDEKYQPKRIMAVVADPKTGAILAMGQRPTFHPTTREGIEQSWHNEIVETSFEPGSTMKIFSLAAAVEENVFNPNEKYTSGSYRVGRDDMIRDHNRGVGWGTITYAEGVERSSNVAFANMLEKMGTETWRNYMDKFKFGTPTGIDLPNEVSGKILYNWQLEKVTSVFGQGTTVTAMQMIQAMTAIANDGKMMKPYVVEKIENPNDDTEQVTKPTVVGKPISEKTAKKVREVLETVITGEHGTGKRFNLDGYKVAGKTGTSQIPNPNGKGYLEGRNNFIFSFLGLAPADDPELIMYVSVEQPQLPLDEVGGTPVSMIFNTVMKSSLQYLNIKPDDIPKAQVVKMPKVVGESVKNAKENIEKIGLDPIIVGKGNQVIGQSPLKQTWLIEGEKVFILTDKEMTIPNMIGWSKRDVLAFTQLAKLQVNMTGNGFVSKQNLTPQSIIIEGDQLVVNLETPEQKLTSDHEPEDDEAPIN